MPAPYADAHAQILFRVEPTTPESVSQQGLCVNIRFKIV